MPQYTQEEIEAAVKIVQASGQFNIVRMRPPIGFCRSCWGHGTVNTDDGWIRCPSCKGTGKE